MLEQHFGKLLVQPIGQFLQCLFVAFEVLIKLRELLHRICVSLRAQIRNFDVKCHGHQIKHVFFDLFAVSVHHMEKVVFFGEQVMVLKMVHKLPVTLFILFLPGWVLSRLPESASDRMTATPWHWVIPCLVRKALKVDALAEGLPSEVKYRVDWLDLDPPLPPLHRFPDESLVVPVGDDVLVTVVEVGVIEWDLARATGLLQAVLACFFGGRLLWVFVDDVGCTLRGLVGGWLLD